jgi:hypothetical protein
MLISTESEERPEDALDISPKKRDVKAQTKTTLFKMKPKK